jgi:hypothetical protein
MKNIHVLLLIVLISSGCAQTRFVEPLEKGQLSIGGNFGGPLIEYAPAVIPIPFLDAEAGYGIDTNLTVHGGLNLTSLFFGNIHLDAGVTYKFLDQRKFRPNVSVTPGFNFVFDLYDHGAKFWPMADINAYWNYGERKNYFYSGFSNYFELSKTMANDLPQSHHWLFSPQIGHVVKGKNQKFQFTTEIKFLGINLDSKYSFIPYSGVTGNAGVTGIYLGFRWIL